MKLFVKLLITAVVLAVLLPFTLIKGKDGRPLMSINDLKLPNFEMPEFEMPKMPKGGETPSLPGVTGGGRTDTVYQWRDADGGLHFTTDPPPPGIEYTVKGYDPNANLIQSVKPVPDEAVAEVGKDQSSTEAPSSAKDRGIGNPYSPEKIEKLFDDAEKVQKLIDERMKMQEDVLNNL